MYVQDVMTYGAATLRTNMTFLETATLFLQYDITAAPVLDEEDAIVGIVSEKDLFRALYPSYNDFYENPRDYLMASILEDTAQDARHKPITEFMSSRVITTTEDTHVLKIGGLMVATGIHRVPVTRENKIVGMVSRGNIYRAIMKENFNVFSLSES